jgi:hypothetical protein
VFVGTSAHLTRQRAGSFDLVFGVIDSGALRYRSAANLVGGSEVPTAA